MTTYTSKNLAPEELQNKLKIYDKYDLLAVRMVRE